MAGIESPFAPSLRDGFFSGMESEMNSWEQMILALAMDWMEGITPESVPGGTI